MLCHLYRYWSMVDAYCLLCYTEAMHRVSGIDKNTIIINTDLNVYN